MDAFTRVAFGLFGLTVLIGIAWLFSNNKRVVDWQLVLTGVALQIGFAALVLLVPGGKDVFDALGNGFVRILSFVSAGSGFVFGGLMNVETYGFIFAFQVLPTIIFFAALMSVLYHLGVMQWIVRGMAWAITKVMRVSGAETTSVSASIFIGQTEAPLTVRPYISKMTDSELITMMIGGMAHIAGGVLAAYVGMLGGGDPVQQAFYAKHLLAASIMAAPATMVVAKLLIPETGIPLTRGTVKMEVEKTTSNVIDAAAAGAADGLRLALNIGAMLLAFIALIALIDWPLTWLGEVTGAAELLGRPTSMATLLGYLLSPVAWLIGVPWQDATVVGGLIGQKIVLNEFVAYLQLAEIVNGNAPGVVLTDQGRLIATYALCGFANFSSIAIQIGGIGGLAPDRRQDVARFGLRAVLGGTIATLMTATIAGVLTSFG
ncbi:MAG: NupC/NupG family nucleoside CNT transporter [Lysobacter sp.]|nr:NupC/NupG family nucleoside CNT transporter [Lysobacter sp.]MDQ3269175.1 NupC/NupG family nucleoside CNT transporter [Pseudomonadota bacterium]